MRSRGRRLSKGDLSSAPRVTGDLLIDDWPDGSSFGRAVRVARLKSIEGGTKADPLQPLFEPAVVRVTRDALVIVGIEIEGDMHGNVADYVQGWLVRPILSD